MTSREAKHGDRVTMRLTRWAGRAGTVMGHIRIGGGYQSRTAVVIRLDATARATTREIHCWESSFVFIDSSVVST